MKITFLQHFILGASILGALSTPGVVKASGLAGNLGGPPSVAQLVAMPRAARQQWEATKKLWLPWKLPLSPMKESIEHFEAHFSHPA